MLIPENEQRIPGELASQSPLFKRDITARCGIGWATAVKLMARLEEQGYVVASGNERQNQAGKSAAAYALSPTRAAAEGIPLEGAGIGVPSHLFGSEGVPYARIAATLTTRIGLSVTVDNNIRCFTAAIANRENVPASMLVVTIRSGIGVGIVIDGKIYQGERGCAGEIGHFPVERDGRPCRCGKSGCLETIVNRDQLSADLIAAQAGEQVALQRAQRAAELLGRAIASMMVVLDIRRVAIDAEFRECGELGHGLLDRLRAAAQEAVYPGFDFSIDCATLDAEAYVDGAARLVLDAFVRR